jgi:hypothetical protein
MLKIRNLIFALSLTPLMSFAWQLPSLAQVSKGAAGTPSGAQTGGTTTTIFDAPPAALPTGGTGGTTGAAPATPATAAAAAAAGAAGAATTTTTTTVGGETVTTPALVTQATTTTGTAVIIPIISGVSATVTSGVSTTGATSAATTTTGGDTGVTVAVTVATVETTSSSVTVTDGGTGNTVVISLAPQAQVVVNQLAAAIVQNLNSIITGGGTTGGGTTGGGTTGGGTTGGGTTGGTTTDGGTTGGTTTDGGTTGGGTTAGTVADVGTLLTGGAGAQQAAVALTNSFTAAGISPQLATALVTSLTGLFGGSTTGSLPNQPLAMTTSGQLVASTKAFKPVTIIAQGSAGISVNINKLNDAIVAYNGIILQSEPKAVKNLSRNGGFVGIGGILKELRTAVK